MRNTAFRTIFSGALVQQSRAFAPAFIGSKSCIGHLTPFVPPATVAFHSLLSRRFLSSFEPPKITQIGKDAMMEIVEDIENSSREESGYVIIDVRNVDEIDSTGKISSCVYNLPLPMVSEGAFEKSEQEFQDLYGFAKPSLDETIVFSCKAGVRAMKAANFAANSGYTNLVSYSGGADEWFQ
jgi:rhodanese-related sulfurtransferase